MRSDLHVHSWYSGRTDVPVLEHVGRECYGIDERQLRFGACQFRAFQAACARPRPRAGRAPIRVSFGEAA